MDVKFRNSKMQKRFESETQLTRRFGSRMAGKILRHMAFLRASHCLADIPAERPFRCHQMKADRDEQFAIDLVQPFRLVFVVDHDPIPRDKFGGIDRERVTAIRIMEVVDYHGG